MTRTRAPVSFYLVIVATNLVLFLSLELGARLYFAALAGPRVLAYGTRWQASPKTVEGDRDAAPRSSVQAHTNKIGDFHAYRPGEVDTYSKYFPNESKTLVDHTGSTVPVRINRRGFRGDDFETAKEPGVVRILTLGSSSTFGYKNRDEETYPFQLEEILNRRAAGRWRFEVINFAIPHAISDNIVAMFRSEGLALGPDFVTLYAGVNDSAIVERSPGRAARVWRWLCDRFLLLGFLDHTFGALIQPSPYVWSDEYARLRSRWFLDNVQTLFEICRSRGIHFIPATQQAKSLMIEREQMHGVTYADEVRLVREKSARGTNYWSLGSIPPEPASPTSARQDAIRWTLSHVFDSERVLLIHSRLMEDLRAWATANAVDLVDIIDVLDRDRDLLLSWVHLHPDANRMVAEAFADRILEVLAVGEGEPGAAPGRDPRARRPRSETRLPPGALWATVGMLDRRDPGDP